MEKTPGSGSAWLRSTLTKERLRHSQDRGKRRERNEKKPGYEYPRREAKKGEVPKANASPGWNLFRGETRAVLKEMSEKGCGLCVCQASPQKKGGKSPGKRQLEYRGREAV